MRLPWIEGTVFYYTDKVCSAEKNKMKKSRVEQQEGHKHESGRERENKFVLQGRSCSNVCLDKTDSTAAKKTFHQTPNSSQKLKRDE